MGKLEIFRTETPRWRQLLSFGEDQTVLSLKLQPWRGNKPTDRQTDTQTDIQTEGVKT